MSKINKAVGKAGLSSLLNRKEPEPEVSYEYNHRPYSYADRNTYPYGARNYGVNSGQTVGRSVGTGSMGGELAYVIENGAATVTAREVRRMQTEIEEALRATLKRRGINVKITGGQMVYNFVEDYLFSGQVTVRGNDGRAYKLVDECHEDDDKDWYQDELDTIDWMKDEGERSE